MEGGFTHESIVMSKLSCFLLMTPLSCVKSGLMSLSLMAAKATSALKAEVFSKSSSKTEEAFEKERNELYAKIDELEMQRDWLKKK
jgi:hypothetical protein